MDSWAVTTSMVCSHYHSNVLGSRTDGFYEVRRFLRCDMTFIYFLLLIQLITYISMS